MKISNAIPVQIWIAIIQAVPSVIRAVASVFRWRRKEAE